MPFRELLVAKRFVKADEDGVLVGVPGDCSWLSAVVEIPVTLVLSGACGEGWHHPRVCGECLQAQEAGHKHRCDDWSLTDSLLNDHIFLLVFLLLK